MPFPSPMDAFVGGKNEEKQGNGYPKCQDSSLEYSEPKGKI